MFLFSKSLLLVGNDSDEPRRVRWRVYLFLKGLMKILEEGFGHVSPLSFKMRRIDSKDGICYFKWDDDDDIRGRATDVINGLKNNKTRELNIIWIWWTVKSVEDSLSFRCSFGQFQYEESNGSVVDLNKTQIEDPTVCVWVIASWNWLFIIFVVVVLELLRIYRFLKLVISWVWCFLK